MYFPTIAGLDLPATSTSSRSWTWPLDAAPSLPPGTEPHTSHQVMLNQILPPDLNFFPSPVWPYWSAAEASALPSLIPAASFSGSTFTGLILGAFIAGRPHKSPFPWTAISLNERFIIGTARAGHKIKWQLANVGLNIHLTHGCFSLLPPGLNVTFICQEHCFSCHPSLTKNSGSLAWI